MRDRTDPRDDARTAALVALGRGLRAAGYRFVTPTPATIARNRARASAAPAADLRDVFGWSRPFAPDMLPPDLAAALRAAGALDDDGPLWRSRLRAATLDDGLYLHSAFPTEAADAVFFGPDSYRFVRFARAAAADRPAPRLLDIGCGTGVGGLALAAAGHGADRLVLADVNPAALALAAANARLAGRPDAALVRADIVDGVDGSFDLIVANPPYMMDPLRRAYRDGGALHGAALSLRMVAAALPRLAPGGRLALYTGVGIAAGHDPFRAAVARLLDGGGRRWRYDELDPDVFGEELDQPAYRAIERIAVVGLVVQA